MSVSRQGFSLLEVMAALAIMGLVLVALSGLKVALLRSVARDTAELERSFVLENFFYEARMKNRKEFSKELEHLEVVLTYRRTPCAAESTLSTIPDIFVEFAEVAQRREKFVSFLYQKPDEKHEKRL